MADKLPADFDADWYAATYRDVALSGLSPQEHYRRFGKLFGRKHKGSPPAKPEPAEPASQPVEKPAAREPVAKSLKPVPAPVVRDLAPAARQPKREASPIIDRPEGLDPADTVPRPAPPRPDGGSDGTFSLATLGAKVGASDGGGAAITKALQAYARLLNLQEATGPANGAAVSCGARPFQLGPTRIDNAWLVGTSRLRVMLAGRTDSETNANGLAVRAYQAHPTSSAELRMLGEGVQLPPVGPVIHDLELLHPLMPLLLELCDTQGVTQALSLLPFPSLLPGGLHGAELKALQTEPNPIDDFWALSERLLQELVGGDGWPERSIAQLVPTFGEPRANPPGLTPPVLGWLSALFGLDPAAANASRGATLQLVLPADCVPTISALVSRRLGSDSGTGSAYLVAETENYRPRWSIALPAGEDFGEAVPRLRPGGAGDAAQSVATASVPLAIAIRSPVSPPLASSDDTARAAGFEAISILIDASDASRSERLRQSIRRAIGDKAELLVRADPPEGELHAALDRVSGGEGWALVPQAAGLRQVAAGARHEILLTISDSVDIGDGSALRAIIDLLLNDATIGSASCALLAEKLIKKEVVLQPASGGLFPTGVSFLSGPRLAFGEPDALQALPDLVYPVVANTLHFTAWRRSALAQLPPAPTIGAVSGDDVRIGLELMRAGYRNWCTTKVAARLSGPYTPRDQIDPVGAGYLRPDRWEDILRQVALVRELF